MQTSQRIAQLIVVMAALIAVFFIVVQNVGASKLYPESWEIDVEYLVSWIEPHVGEDDETFGVIGIAFPSLECPDGAAMLEFVVYPEIYPRNGLVDICDGGSQMVDRRMTNVLGHMLELRLQYGVYVSEQSYCIVDMSHDQFWSEIFDAQNAVVVYQQYVPVIGG